MGAKRAVRRWRGASPDLSEPNLRIFPTLLLTAASFLMPQLAQAQSRSSGSADADGDIVIAGVGLGRVTDYEGSDDYRLLPVPGAIGSINGIGFVYIGNRLSVDLIPAPKGPGWDLIAGPVVSVGFNRSMLKSIDDPRIRALGKVGMSVELGGMVGVARRGVFTSDYDRLSATVSVRHDVAGGHGGTLVNPTLSYMTPLSTRSMTMLFASATHADGSYTRTYYTITPAQSGASGLPVFDAKPGWKDWTVGGAVNVSLTGDLTGGLSAIGGIAYTRMLNDYAASPVVSIAGSRDQWMMGLGLAYTF